MSLNNLLADTIARINNAQSAKHSEVIMSHSNFIESIIKLLNEQGYLGSYEVFEVRENVKMMKVKLKYYRGAKVISEMKMLSKPSCRSYVKSKKIPVTRNGLGITVVSTNRGIMHDAEARKRNLGGECLMYVS